eukprot:5201805-Pyramimonas_sp.AAC.1
MNESTDSPNLPASDRVPLPLPASSSSSTLSPPPFPPLRRSLPSFPQTPIVNYGGAGAAAQGRTIGRGSRRGLEQESGETGGRGAGGRARAIRSGVRGGKERSGTPESPRPHQNCSQILSRFYPDSVHILSRLTSENQDLM